MVFLKKEDKRRKRKRERKRKKEIREIPKKARQLMCAPRVLEPDGEERGAMRVASPSGKEEGTRSNITHNFYSIFVDFIE